MRKKFLSFMLLTLLAGAAPGAAADGYGRGFGDPGFEDRAKVVHVEPLVRLVRVSDPVRECWDEPVTRTRYHHRGPGRSESYTPSILGGILGGVVGNRFGSGTGKDVMTVAGTVLGASLGNDVSRANRGRGYREHYTTTETRCSTRERYREVEEHDGYMVTYRYRGQEYRQHMSHHPGEWVRVRVDVQPLDY
jgi:uncharacterized protein YcfJ